MVLRKGITGFCNSLPLKNSEINNILTYIEYPYIYSNIIEPQINNNYYVVNIQNKINGLKFKLLINGIYYVIAGVAMESKWMELEFINLPADFIGWFRNTEIMILNKEILETEAPEEEIKTLEKNEINQINYWKSKTYGEIIFNGYD
jgi:hypothetical protein